MLCLSAVAFAPLYVLKELIMGSGDAIVRQSAGTAFDMYQKLAFTGVLVSAFVNGDWRRIYDYALAHDFRFLSYGDSSLLIP